MPDRVPSGKRAGAGRPRSRPVVCHAAASAVAGPAAGSPPRPAEERPGTFSSPVPSRSKGFLGLAGGGVVIECLTAA